jgi:hypothetical protein
MIKSKPYPIKWDLHTEVQPLTCSMAFELYLLGDTLVMPQLRHKAMSYIYDAYMTTQTVPGPARMEHLEDTLDDCVNLWRFCVDCYVTWYWKGVAETGSWHAYRGVKELPDGFLEEVPKRSAEVETFVAESKIAWYMELKDYCS